MGISLSDQLIYSTWHVSRRILGKLDLTISDFDIDFCSYAMRLHLDDDLKGVDYVGFQCALLYTSPKGDRRIRVHTMSLPVTSSVQEIHNNADGKLKQCMPLVS